MKKTSGIAQVLYPALILFCCLFLLGWADSWEDIQRESAKITSIQARFTQSKHMKILSKPLISIGKFYFQAPASVRWEYASPVKSVLLMSASSMKRFTQGSQGMVEDTGGQLQSMQVVLQAISQWSRGRFTDNDHFAATLKGGKEPAIVLTPRDKGLSKMISRIVITLATDRPGLPRSVKIFESEGNYTLFEFSDAQMNAKIRESLFRDAE